MGARPPGADGWQRWQRWRREYAPLEQGLVDWPAFIRLLRRRGYDGYLSNEDTRPVPLVERLTSARDSIIRLWNAAAADGGSSAGSVPR